MSKEHHLVVIPCLCGRNLLFDRAVNAWSRFGFIPHPYEMTWKDNKGFSPKLARLLKTVDDLQINDSIVSLVGTSAGGSMALNAFYERQDSIHRVINVCGRLRSGVNVFPTLDQAAKSSPSFKESVLRCEDKESDLSVQARGKIMTIRALLDEVVPTSTSTIQGARNLQIYSVEHMFSIAVAMTICARPMVEFLKENEN